jgi:glutathionyl-hydroquinone reductase
MLRGDISNETPPRIIVIIDVAVQSELSEEKKLLRKSEMIRKVTSLNNAQLSKLWNAAFNYGLAVELAAFENEGWTQEHIDKLMNRLDNRGGNPFNYAELYANISDFISELPYRANLKGVVDIDERVARYGSWGIELNSL